MPGFSIVCAMITIVAMPLVGVLLTCVTRGTAALKTVNEIMRRRIHLDLDSHKKPREQLEECVRLLLNEVADVTNL